MEAARLPWQAQDPWHPLTAAASPTARMIQTDWIRREAGERQPEPDDRRATAQPPASDTKSQIFLIPRTPPYFRVGLQSVIAYNTQVYDPKRISKLEG